MNPERKEILNLVSLPGRMNAAEAAWRLGFEPDHIPILVTAGQLKPLGNPPPGAVKFFLTAEIEQKKGDARWMNKATELIRLKVKDKNERAAKSRTLKGSVSNQRTQPMETIPMTVIPDQRRASRFHYTARGRLQGRALRASTCDRARLRRGNRF